MRRLTIAECGLRIWDRRRAGAPGCARTQSEIRIPKSQIERSAFTLIELLVAISILAILGGAVLFASFEASEAARRAATRTRINTINTLLMELWDSYATRRVPIDVDAILAARYPSGAHEAIVRREKSQLPLQAIRELMLLEMPDRWTDVTRATIGDPPDIRHQGPPVLVQRTALSNAYLRRYERIVNGTNSLTGQRNTLAELMDKQGAECLYMIVMLATADGEARSFFKESDIGDVDGDGAPEFLDGWGQPIEFIRWAPGFAALSEVMSGDPVEDHDPFDLFRIDANAYRLKPLIYSIGPDGDGDLDSDFSRTDPRSGAPLQTSMSNDLLLGAPNADNDGDNWTDNIHNHIADVKGL